MQLDISFDVFVAGVNGEMGIDEIGVDEKIDQFYENILNRDYYSAKLVLKQIKGFRLSYRKSIENVYIFIYPSWKYSYVAFNKLANKCPENLFDQIYFYEKILFWEAFYDEQIKYNNYEYIDKNLSGLLNSYSPKLFYYWAKNLLRKNDVINAGKYFLMSGLFSDTEEVYVDRFLKQFKNTHPNQIISKLGSPFILRYSRNKIPLKTIEKLNSTNAPDWIKRRLNI